MENMCIFKLYAVSFEYCLSFLFMNCSSFFFLVHCLVSSLPFLCVTLYLSFLLPSVVLYSFVSLHLFLVLSYFLYCVLFCLLCCVHPSFYYVIIESTVHSLPLSFIPWISSHPLVSLFSLFCFVLFFFASLSPPLIYSDLLYFLVSSFLCCFLLVLHLQALLPSFIVPSCFFFCFFVFF